MGRRRFLQILTGLGAFFGGLFRPLIAGGQVAPTVTAEPNTLTLLPGGSAQVTVTVDPASAYGTGSVTITVEVPYNGTIAGDFAGVVPAGEHWHITGDVNLTGDLIVEGLLTGVDTFTLTGNGFQILVQNGGQLDLRGIEKTGWLLWGDIPTGWQSGDLCGITSTKEGIFNPTGTTWTGSWATTVRSANSPDVTLPPNPLMAVARPEVANLVRSIVLKNLFRIHFQNGAGVQTLKYVSILDCGVTGVLGRYPLHFHLCGETVRGSLIEGVVVRNGKNHAFVVHGSHGVTLRDCVAYNIINDAFWWDSPLDENHTINNSNDTLYDHCLAAYVWPNPGDAGVRLAAFVLGAGSGNSVVDSVATAVQGGADAGGFVWPESANQNIGGNEWMFRGNVAHNNKADGIFVWQNDSHSHLIEDYVGYHSRLSQIDHGAYDNRYTYRRCVLKGGAEAAFKLHAHGEITLDGVYADGTFRLMKQQSDASIFVVVKNCSFPSVYYSETGNGGTKASKVRYEDNVNPDAPADFNLSGIVIRSIIEIYKAGVLIHRWANGAWTTVTVS